MWAGVSWHAFAWFGGVLLLGWASRRSRVLLAPLVRRVRRG